MTHLVDLYVAQRLYQARRERRISRQRLGDCVGLTNQQIGKYEQALNGIRASRLYDLSCCLALPVDYFFEGIEEYYLCPPCPLKPKVSPRQ